VAHEILAIPASEVDYKRLFSEGRDLLGIQRYVMSGETVRIMMLLKGALRSKTEIEKPEKSSVNGPDVLYMPQRQNQQLVSI
jgi:hypothetical protein